MSALYTAEITSSMTNSSGNDYIIFAVVISRLPALAVGNLSFLGKSKRCLNKIDTRLPEWRDRIAISTSCLQVLPTHIAL